MAAPHLSWKDMPGTLKGVNLFDAAYSGLTYGLVNVLGRLGRTSATNRTWRPGEKLQILFLAYSGARNTGAEVRVAECIRQVNQVLGEDRVDINMSTLDLHEAGEYFRGYHVNLKAMSAVFFKDIYRLVLENHLIVLVEGSCWKENFATALLLYFLYGAGLAAQLGKPAFSYAVDAGQMNRLNNYLSHLLSRDLTRIITRSADSTQVLESIGLHADSTRVDTAWTQQAETPEFAAGILKARGWDGKKPLVGLAMQNYQRWPVVPDVAKFARTLVTGDHKNQYKLVYYYDYSAADERADREWAQMLARTMDGIVEKHGAQPVLVAMEALDEESCKDVTALMRNKPILASCNEFVGTQLAAILRTLSLLVTTRYHAMVLSMPGRVPFIGVSRDERIRGVMKEIGLFGDYYLDHREDGLESKIAERADRILGDPDEADRFREVIRKHLPYYYAQMALLGLDIRDMVRSAFPGFVPKDLDENDAMQLIPYAPPDLVKSVKAKYQFMKAKEGRG